MAGGYRLMTMSQAGVLHGHQAYGTAFGEEYGSADRVHLCCQVSQSVISVCCDKLDAENNMLLCDVFWWWHSAAYWSSNPFASLHVCLNRLCSREPFFENRKYIMDISEFLIRSPFPEIFLILFLERTIGCYFPWNHPFTFGIWTSPCNEMRDLLSGGRICHCFLPQEEPLYHCRVLLKNVCIFFFCRGHFLKTIPCRNHRGNIDNINNTTVL